MKTKLDEKNNGLRVCLFCWGKGCGFCVEKKLTNGRVKLDFYPTDKRLTVALLDRVDVGGIVLEPCAGRLDMADVLASSAGVERVITNDIAPNCNTDHHMDAADPEASFWRYPAGVNWVVTNPPFNRAHEILPIALETAVVGVAFLLRLNYLEPTSKKNARGTWLQDHADQMTNLFTFGSTRPHFPPYTKGDSVTTAWMVWKKDWSWADLGIKQPFDFVMNWKI